MAIALRACLALIAAGLLTCGPVVAASTQTVQVATGVVSSEDMHLANNLVSDDRVTYTTADKDGVYRLRKVPNAAWETLSRDDFLAFARTQLVGRTTISPLDFDDGWRIRYMAADGKVYAWDSRSDKVTSGDWTIQVADAHVGTATIQVAQTCTSITADLRQLNAEPRCYPAAWDFAYPERTAETGRETRDGDPFGLSKGHKPKITPKTNETDVRPQWPDEVKQ